MVKLSVAALCLLAPCGVSLAQQQGAAPKKATSGPVPSPSSPPIPNTLMDGTAIKLRLTETISSAKAKVGQSVSFEVVDEVDVMGVPVVAKGAQALATVTVAETKKSMGRGGKLDVNIDSVRMIDGEKASLRATEGGKGGGHTGLMTAGMVGTALVFLPAAPLLLFIHGKDITIPKGTEVTSFVSGDLKLELAKFAPTGTPMPGSGMPAGNGALANLSVESSVAGADIEVDGAFMGSTPSTLSIKPGQHTITVKKKGYLDWSRTMNVAGDGIRLNADLDAKP